MRSTKRTDTSPELALRSVLHRAGARFRKDYPVKTEHRSVRPDIVFPARRLAVFVDGCFWHRCPEHGTQPRAHGDFWRAKLDRNVERDRETDAALEAAGWRVFRCWEHEPPEEAAVRILSVLDQRTENSRK
jgi:DNA mismatch endonuclease, patch repair protein